MRRMLVGVAAALAMSFAGSGLAEDMTEEIQEEEQPGSEIEIEIGGGGATIERKSGAPVFRLGEADTQHRLGPRRCERPGEGPEDLSGPDDGDPLPE